MLNPQKIKKNKKDRRRARVRAKIFGTAQRPRLSVFKSLKHIEVQLIDDSRGKTLVSANDRENKSSRQKSTKTERALAVGKSIAQKATDKKIKTCVFDKASYKYHGRVKAVADGAREGGLKF